MKTRKSKLKNSADQNHPFILSEHQKCIFESYLNLAIESIGKQKFARSLIRPDFINNQSTSLINVSK